MTAPQEAHLEIGFQTLQYLKGTLDNGILFRLGYPLQLQGYTDATWGYCLDTFRSTGAYTFTLAGGTFSWCLKKQNLVPLSSTESEYKAVFRCTRGDMVKAATSRNQRHSNVANTTLVQRSQGNDCSSGPEFFTRVNDHTL